MEQPFLVGERLYLRPMELEHADLVRGWLNDPQVRRTIARNAPMTRLGEEAFLRARSEKETAERVLLMVTRGGAGGPGETDAAGAPSTDAAGAASRPIGVLGLHQPDLVHRHAILGVLVGEVAEWGKGYAGEAIDLLLGHGFDELGLHRVMLNVYAFNTRGLRCYEKLGFVREGVLREDHFAEGRFHDTIVMGLLAHEWRARRRER